ncbi:MAG: hypothetical protein E2P06_15270 [Acidobacteria bacterium]|nr:MAG: hypothetical protein E2P06_15270 [Acidobacteriota bacterium]
MRVGSFACVATVMALGLLLAPMSARGGQDGAYAPPRTEWGDPDFRGHYLPGASQPMETPVNDSWRPPEGSNLGQGAAFSRFFEPDPDAPPRAARITTPMVVDPADGRIPFQPWAAEQRGEIMARQDVLEYLDPRVKCLPSGLPRAHLPVGYNTYQIVQIPGYVVMLYEWNHLYRYIPLDGRPHVNADIRLGMGDSRGHWEGNTLVVDVTNFTENTWVVGHGAPPEGAPASALTTGHGVFHSDALHVVERFTMSDADTIHYEVTIEDPQVFTQPWTIVFDALTRAPEDHMLFEYACHEGNGRNISLMTGTDIDAARVHATR